MLLLHSNRYIVIIYALFFQHSLPLRDDGIHSLASLSHQYFSVSWKAKKFHFQVLGLEESFSFSPSLLYTIITKKKLEREPKRPPKNMGHLIMKARKKTTRLDGPTHTHIHTVTHTPTRSIDHTWSLSLCVKFVCASFFLLKMEIISQPPLMIWSWVLLSTTSYPTFFSILYIITTPYHSVLRHGKHEGASVGTWILGARTLSYAGFQAFTPSRSQAGQHRS